MTRSFFPKMVLYVQLLLMALVCFAPFYSKDTHFSVHEIGLMGKVVLGALALVGVVLIGGARRAMGKAFTIQAIPRSNGFLALDWPFTWVRNPMYTALIILGWVWSMWNRSTFTLVVTFFLIITLKVKVSIEERGLLAQYGDEYRKYCARVGRFFPGVGLWKN